MNAIKMPLRVSLILIIAALLVTGLYAQEAAVNRPASMRLEGLVKVWQQFNRCSAAAFTMQISYYGWEGKYDDMIRVLNPHAEDVSVRLEEMVAYAETQGLKGIIRTGGTVDMLRALVAAGFPVLIENSYYDGANGWKDWMSHNRVVMGYDDEKRVLYTYDSLLGYGDDGSGRPVPYDELDERWKPFNRDYLVLYKPGDEILLEKVMGDQWDETYNHTYTLQLAEDELKSPDADSFSLFNKGSSLVALGRYEEAAEAFDKARQLGLPWRMLWYQFGPFEAYLQVGRYDDTIKLVRNVLSGTPGVEEMYYYIGRAYEAQGDTRRAQANYEAALFRNKNFVEAQQALAKLTGDGTTQVSK